MLGMCVCLCVKIHFPLPYVCVCLFLKKKKKKYAWNGCSSLTIDMKPNLLWIWILSFSHLTKSNHIDNLLTIYQRFNFDILVLVV